MLCSVWALDSHQGLKIFLILAAQFFIDLQRNKVIYQELHFISSTVSTCYMLSFQDELLKL